MAELSPDRRLPSTRTCILLVLTLAVFVPVAVACGAIVAFAGLNLSSAVWAGGIVVVGLASVLAGSSLLLRDIHAPLVRLGQAFEPTSALHNAGAEGFTRLGQESTVAEVARISRGLAATLEQSERQVQAQRTNEVQTVHQALDRSEARLRSVFSQVHDAVVIADKRGRIESVNDAAERLFGFSADRLLGQPVGQLLPEVFVSEPSLGSAEEKTRQIALGFGAGVETTGRRADGSMFPMECSVSIVSTDTGRLFTWIMHDITNRVRAEAARAATQAELEQRVGERTRELRDAVLMLQQEASERRRAEDEALKASRAKSTFLANMSHELRTPLNAIIGYTELLREESEDLGAPAFVDDLDKIHRSANHLLLLINDVLDLSKIEAGKMDVQITDVSVHQLVDEVTSTITPLALANTNTLLVRLSPEVHTVPADATKLRQALLNMLSNACKFTHRGTITLNISAIARDGRPWVAFEVVDTGIGISAENVDRLFSPFVQEDSSTTRRFGGTGLGLSISRSFCRMMGGDMVAQSTKGVGSTFSILLPLHSVAAQLAQARREASTRIPARVPSAPSTPVAALPSGRRAPAHVPPAPATIEGLAPPEIFKLASGPALRAVYKDDDDPEETAVMDAAHLNETRRVFESRPASNAPAAEIMRRPRARAPRDSDSYLSVRDTHSGAAPARPRTSDTGELREVNLTQLDPRALLEACDLLEVRVCVKVGAQPIDATESALLRRIDGRTSVKDLVDRDALDPNETSRALVALLERGAITA